MASISAAPTSTTSATTGSSSVTAATIRAEAPPLPAARPSAAGCDNNHRGIDANGGGTKMSGTTDDRRAAAAHSSAATEAAGVAAAAVGAAATGGASAPTSPGETSQENISYSAERIIGNGSFGVVFEAKVVETNEVVAIKKVLQDKRFKNRELQIMRQLVKDPHTNIVALRHCFYSQVRYHVLLCFVI